MALFRLHAYFFQGFLAYSPGMVLFEQKTAYFDRVAALVFRIKRPAN
jgi:hypothetical protein